MAAAATTEMATAISPQFTPDGGGVGVAGGTAVV